MLVLYPKNEQERKEVFNYSNMIYTNRSLSSDTAYAIIRIKNEYNEIIYNATSYLYISAHDSEKLDFYLIRKSIKLKKIKTIRLKLSSKI